MEDKKIARLSEVEPVLMKAGHLRSTLAYNKDLQLCHFKMKKGVKGPIHTHKAAQVGFVISGKLEFYDRNGTLILAGPGDSYVFDSMQEHGSTVLEDTVFIEVFSPAREEYM